MKSILTIISSLLIVVSAIAQSKETLQVDITKLSQEELRIYQQMKQKEVEASKFLNVNNLSPESIDKYGQMAKAFGVAVKEGLGAITKNVDEFAQTGAGKMTIALIAWKVMGNDAVNLVEKTVQYAIGFPLLFIGTMFFIIIMRRNCFECPTLVGKTKVGWFTIKSEYKGTTGANWGGEAAAICCLFYALFIGICSLIIFVG